MDFLRDTSVAEVFDFIKQFHFQKGSGIDLYTQMIFSDATKIRVSPAKGHVKLKRDVTTQFFPLDTDIWARTWTTTPKSCRKLKMLEVFPVTQPTDTTVNIRIFDGTNDLYWDGAAWSVAGAGDWNTEAEINANIDTFPILPDREFAITMNLVTTDQEVSPTVEEIRVLMEVRIDYIEDIVLRSLMPELKTHIKPTSNFILPVFAEDTGQIELLDYRLNTPYTIVDVAGVFDFTDDPELLTDLLDTYDPGSFTITLLDDIPTGNQALVLFRYSPEVIFIQHQDWLEVAKLPSLLIQQLEVPTASSYNLVAREGIVDKGTGNAVIIKEPWRATLQFRLHGLTASVVDEMRLISGVIKFFEEHVMIRSVGLDEWYRIEIEREFRDLSNPNRADQRAFWTQFTIYDVRLPMLSSIGYAVRRLSLQFQGPKPPHEDPVKGGSRIIATEHSEDGPVEWDETIEIT